MVHRLRSLLAALVGRSRFEDGMSDEMRFHIDAYTDDLVRRGVPPEVARRRARVEFGGLEAVKDDCREARGLRLVDAVIRDTRYALRLLRRAPGFTVTALATLAICIGANLTIFAVVDALLFKPLPFPEAGRLVTVYNTYPKAGVPNDGCSLPNYYERRGRIAAFSGLSVYRNTTAVVGDAGATEQLPATRVSADYFDTLGVKPAIGRAFTDAEMEDGADRVVIVTDGFWRQRLGGDPRVLGRTVRVGGVPFTVVGVLPRDFRFLSSKTRLYFPLASKAAERSVAERHAGTSLMVARLKPGVAVEAAQGEIDAHNAMLEASNPKAPAMADAGFRSIVAPLRADYVASVRRVVLLVQAGALLLLLIGLVNLVNLLLIRASARTKERAVRQAIGAGRGRIVAEIAIETSVLAALGGALGVCVGAGGIRLLAALGAEQLPLGATIAFDGRLALMAFVAAAGMGIAMGAPVAWYCLRDRSSHPLHLDARGATTNRAVARLRHAFLVAQIALAFVLLSGAGLLGLSLEHAMSVPSGFRPEQTLTGRILATRPAFPDDAALLAFTSRLSEELARQPGVRAAGIATNVPLSGISNKTAVSVEGHVRRSGESPQGSYAYSVDGDFFTAIGATLVEGRFLTAADSRRPERNAVIDESFARRYWPAGHALGGRLFLGLDRQADAEAFTIVGVVQPMKQADLTDDQTQGAAYFPFGHRMDGRFFVVARTTLPPASLARTLQDTVRSLSPEQPVSDVATMETRVAESLVARRSPALLAGMFSAIALLLSAIGTYGVLSYAVARRRREIGLRMALGARPEQVRAQFIAIALRLVAAGGTLGLVGAWLAGRALQAILFHVPGFHAATLAAAATVIALMSIGACVVPSHRAAHTSPLEAMSEE